MSKLVTAEEIAERLYELDIKVYESTVSKMGKVFPAGKELSMKHMVNQIKKDNKHFFKDETTLISNMINTVRDTDKAIEFRNELKSLKQLIDEYSPVVILPDSFESNNSIMKNRFSNTHHMILCIGRQYGSGGHEIGYRLAEKLGISYYDKKILNITSEHFNSDIKSIEEHDEKIGKQSFFDKNPLKFLGFSGNDSLFFAQSALIQKIAKEGDCIILGRCSDVILEHAGIPRLSVFIGAPFEERVKHEMSYTDLSHEKAVDLVHQKDKERKSYYNYYTSRKWGHSSNYDLCINTACYGIDGSVELLENMINLSYRK